MTISVTGYAARTSLGDTAPANFRALSEGRSGLGVLRGFPDACFAGGVAYQIADGEQDRQPEGGRATRLLVEAIARACTDAGVSPADLPVVVGTGLAELRTLEVATCADRTPTIEELDIGQAVRRRLGTGPVTTVVNACSASLHALALACDMLTLGEAETVVVAGVDVLTASMHGLLARVQQVGPAAVTPFESGPKGVIMGEGAVAVVLTAVPTAGVPKVTAVSMNCDARHVTAPDRAGMAEAIRLAHESAGIAPRDVDLVLVHGTGTPQNDVEEGAAMHLAFGVDVASPAALAIKSLTGHTSGASGLVAVVVALEAMRHKTVPPNRPIRAIIDEARGIRFGTVAESKDVRVAQVNAFGFGGVNAVAIIENDPSDTSPPRPEAPVRRAFPVVAAAVLGTEEDPRAVLAIRGLRYKDTASLAAMAVSTRLLGDPTVAERVRSAPERVGIVVGSNLCNVDTVARVAREIRTGGVAATSPMDLPNASPNVVASSVAILLGLRGPNLLLAGYPQCRDDALQVGRRLIAADRADFVLVIGVEPPTAVARQICPDRSRTAALLLSRSEIGTEPWGVVDDSGLRSNDRAGETFGAAWAALRGTQPLIDQPQR